MQIRKLTWFIINYIPEFIFGMYHEICHWIVAFIFYILGINDLPSINIKRNASIQFNNDNSTSTYSWMMNITYESYGDTQQTLPNVLVTLAPLFGTILLFYVSPWYLWLFYVPYLDQISLSLGDNIQIEAYIKSKFKRNDK